VSGFIPKIYAVTAAAGIGKLYGLHEPRRCSAGGFNPEDLLHFGFFDDGIDAGGGIPRDGVYRLFAHRGVIVEFYAVKIAARFAAAPGCAVGDIPRIIRRRYTKALIGKLLEIERNTAAFKFSFRKIIAPGKKKRARQQQKTDFHDFPPNAYGF
jgi:hypothetical protein